MFVSVEFITGCMVGVELVDKRLVGDEKGWIFVLDLLIIRIMFDN